MANVDVGHHLQQRGVALQEHAPTVGQMFETLQDMFTEITDRMDGLITQMGGVGARVTGLQNQLDNRMTAIDNQLLGIVNILTGIQEALPSLTADQALLPIRLANTILNYDQPLTWPPEVPDELLGQLGTPGEVLNLSVAVCKQVAEALALPVLGGHPTVIERREYILKHIGCQPVL